MNDKQKCQILEHITDYNERREHFTDVYKLADLLALEAEGLLRIHRIGAERPGDWECNLTEDGESFVNVESDD